MANFISYDRTQAFLLPPDLHDWIGDDDPGCVNPISWQILRKIDSCQHHPAQQCFATTRRLVPLLREGFFSERFDTAWTHYEHRDSSQN